MPEIVIKGMNELSSKLRELDFSLQRKALIEVAKAGAEILRDAAADLAPRGETGNLAAGMTMRVSSKESDIHEATVDVGPSRDQFYGLFVERGTKQRADKKGRNRGAMKAHPFLRPALEASRGRMAEAMKMKMLEIIHRVAK